MVGIISTTHVSPSVNHTKTNEINQQRLVQTPATPTTQASSGVVPSEDQFVNLNTSQALANTEANEQYSHQRYVAYNAYINLGHEEGTPALSPAESFAKIQDAGKVNEASLEPTATTVNPQAGDPTTAVEQDKSGSKVQGQEDADKSSQDKDEESKKVDGNTPRAPNGEPLTEEEQAELREMQARDEEVRVHEQAHKSAGGQYAGSPQYEYANGPDGKRYITDGSVSIDVSEESDPQATIEKMQIVKRAALAPAEPSSQDRSVYAEANQIENEARQQLNEEKQEEAAENAQKATSGAEENKDTSGNTAAASTAATPSAESKDSQATPTTANGAQAEPQNGAHEVTNGVKPRSSSTQGTSDSKDSSDSIPGTKSSSVPKGPQTPSRLSQSVSDLSSNSSGQQPHS